MGRFPDTSPVTGADGWTEHYGVHSKYFSRRHFLITILWASPGWNVTICGAKMKSQPTDLDQAKRLGVSALRKMLLRALAEIPTETEQAT